SLRNVAEILLDLLRIRRPLINLDDLSATVNQKGGRKATVAMPVKNITKNNVVNAGEIIRSLQDGQRELALPCRRPDSCSVRRIVEIQSENVKALGCPT